jgi:uncharacterized peroxidase-related enzyme
MEDYRTAPIGAEMKQLLSFAEKVARDARLVSSEDIEALRSAGFSDRAILDAAHVAGFFSYMNRVVQALGADSTTTRTEAAQRSSASAVPFHYDVATEVK